MYYIVYIFYTLFQTYKKRVKLDLKILGGWNLRVTEEFLGNARISESTAGDDSRRMKPAMDHSG